MKTKLQIVETPILFL